MGVPLHYLRASYAPVPLNVTSKIKLYADDILLYHTISSVTDFTLLQKDIDSLQYEFLHVTNKFSPIIYYHLATTWMLNL